MKYNATKLALTNEMESSIGTAVERGMPPTTVMPTSITVNAARISHTTTGLVAFLCGCGCAPTSVSCVVTGCSFSMLNQIHNRKNENPDQIHKVPVQAEHFHRRVVAGRERPVARPQRDGNRPQHADKDVQPVQARQGEER